MNCLLLAELGEVTVLSLVFCVEKSDVTSKGEERVHTLDFLNTLVHAPGEMNCELQSNTA